jgi:hypothetical protein
MATDEERQAIADSAQFDLLPVGYWVSAGFWGFYALCMVAYFAIFGTLFMSIPKGDSGAPPPALGWFFVIVGCLTLVIAAVFVTLKVLAGFWLRRRTHRAATMVIAALGCLELPYGTLIGVWTFIGMARPAIRAQYGLGARTTPACVPSAMPPDESAGQPAPGGSPGVGDTLG